MKLNVHIYMLCFLFTFNHKKIYIYLIILIFFSSLSDIFMIRSDNIPENIKFYKYYTVYSFNVVCLYFAKVTLGATPHYFNYTLKQNTH